MTKVFIRRMIMDHGNIAEELADLAIELTTTFQDKVTLPLEHPPGEISSKRVELVRKYHILEARGCAQAMKIGTALRDGTANVPSKARRNPDVATLLGAYTEYAKRPSNEAHIKIVNIITGIMVRENAKATITGKMMRFQ